MDYLDQKKDENRLKCATDFGTKDMQALDKVIENRKGKKIKFPYGSTQVKSLETVICGINGLLTSKGFPALPLDLYTDNLDLHFEGAFIPEILCNRKYDAITC